MSVVDYEIIAEIIADYNTAELVEFLEGHTDEAALWRTFTDARQLECECCGYTYHEDDINWEGHCETCQAIIDGEEAEADADADEDEEGEVSKDSDE